MKTEGEQSPKWNGFLCKMGFGCKIGLNDGYCLKRIRGMAREKLCSGGWLAFQNRGWRVCSVPQAATEGQRDAEMTVL